MNRALETQKAKKELKEECQNIPGAKWKNGKCETPETTETNNPTPGKAPEDEQPEQSGQNDEGARATPEIDEQPKPSNNEAEKNKDKKAKEKTIQKINNAIHNIGIGKSITYDKKYENDPQIERLINAWYTGCETAVKAHNGKEPSYLSDRKDPETVHCYIKTCSAGFKRISNTKCEKEPE